MSDEIEDFFANAGGTFAPSFKFDGIGSGLKGEVVSTKVQDQTEFQKPDTPKRDRNGNVLKQLQVILQTELRNFDKVTDKSKVDQDGNRKDASEDTGTRAIYLKNQMTQAVADALRAHGLKALEVGGTLAVKKVGEKDTGKGNPLPLFEAKYWPAPKAAEGEDFFNESSPAAAAPETAAASDDEPPF